MSDSADKIVTFKDAAVVSYVPGGHYHAHLDSNDRYDRPCCFQERCEGKALTPQWAGCCRLCRYITVLYYLNDVEEGGETAFPLADASDTTLVEKFENLEEQEWHNLSYYCHNSSLVIKPVRGTAIMWYSHFKDEQTGYLGKADQRSQHGGCDLIKGSKWIANNWISSPSYEDRFKPSLYYTES
ncbi:transmembrane prolyl 4-hydroxylase-like [Dreissena polymorpha]|uniref:transmembrane prolyl 4-hydroxylase-like n=1 Tax=Dreissena polymorpha TaxID=45954 RepID=UPI00226426F8|nr:transmembrane prolyl 4-hydroxylase-like [Dreissena polymorpha]